MRRATYLVGAALIAAVMMSGAVVMPRNTADTPNPAGQEGATMTSSNDPSPSDEVELEDDYDLTLEDPIIEDGEPTTWEEFARDAAVGQHPDGPPPAVGGQAIFGGDSIVILEGTSQPPR